jgi:gamma-glutamyltranspeptidase/glutathione hydrolase
MPPPSAGGAALAVLLKILEELGAYRLEQGSTDRLHLFIEASKRAQSQRRFEVGDPDWLDGGELSQKIARWTNPKALLASAPIDLKRGTPSAKVHPLYQLGLRELEHTTHFSVVDAQGMVVSCTVTLSAGFGAKMVVSGTGIVLNNSVAAFGTAGPNRPAPGHRSTSSMAPTLVLKNETPVLVLGSPGGDTIPSTVAQVLTNVIDRGMTIDQAVDAPRIHHGFVPDELRIESDPGLPARMVSELLARGHHLSKVRMPMGDANVILIQDKVAWAYADPREDGLALAAR